MQNNLTDYIIGAFLAIFMIFFIGWISSPLIIDMIIDIRGEVERLDDSE